MENRSRKLVGSGARGWMMLSQALLKPVLMAGGLVAGMLMAYVVP